MIHIKNKQFLLLLLVFLSFASCNRELKTAKLVVTPWESTEFSTYLTKFDPIFSDLCIHHYLVDSFTSKTFYLDPKNLLFEEPIAFCIEPFCLSKGTPIEISQIEEFIQNRRLETSNIREKLYWLCQTTRARLIRVTNQYGDLEGYSAIVEDEEIPSEYYFVTKMLGEDQISPYAIKLGEEQLGNSYFRYYIQIDDNIGLSPIQKRKGTPIKLTEKKFKPLFGMLKLYIIVESCYHVNVVDNEYVITDRLVPFNKKIVFDK